MTQGSFGIRSSADDTWIEPELPLDDACPHDAGVYTDDEGNARCPECDAKAPWSDAWRRGRLSPDSEW